MSETASFNSKSIKIDGANKLVIEVCKQRVIAVSVISWKIILFVCLKDRLKREQICQAIPSPSLSSSVARMTSLQCVISPLILLICDFLVSIGVNDGLTFSSMINDIPSEFVNGIGKFFSKLGF